MHDFDYSRVDTTLGSSRNLGGYFKPDSIADLIASYQTLKAKYKNISVFSKGKNWGYGCHAPNGDEDLLIDLSLCKKIINFDSYHGVITLEPGVSYFELAEYLKDNGDEWIAPVLGAGGDASVLGNTLERGYGITPYTDHFNSVLSLEAILANGKLYKTSFKKLGLDKLDHLFKYGIGPYYDGLFSQSGYGIVTQVTIRLARKPDYVEMFYYNINEDDDLLSAVEKIKKIKRDLGSSLGGINLINRERCLSMVVDYPLDKIKSGDALTDEEIKSMSRKYHISPWLIVGMIYGRRPIVKEVKKQVHEEFKSIIKRSYYFNSDNKWFYHQLSQILPLFKLDHLQKSLKAVFQAYDILIGRPNNLALKLAYWKHERKSELLKNPHLDPNRDNCGLIWYSPLVELKPDSVDTYIKFMKESARKFNMNPLVTLTTIDDLCFDSTVPILFNKESPKDTEKAKSFYNYLLTQGRKLGFFPYRLNIDSQSELNLKNDEFNIPSFNQLRYK